MPNFATIINPSSTERLSEKESDRNGIYGFQRKNSRNNRWCTGHRRWHDPSDDIPRRPWLDFSIEEIENLMPILSCNDLEKVKEELKTRV